MVDLDRKTIRSPPPQTLAPARKGTMLPPPPQLLGERRGEDRRRNEREAERNKVSSGGPGD
jgi:hypothetical protein